jgi:hypothetical protein
MTLSRSSAHTLGTSNLVNSQDQTAIGTESTTSNTLAASSLSEHTPLLHPKHSHAHQKYEFSEIKREAWVWFLLIVEHLHSSQNLISLCSAMQFQSLGTLMGAIDYTDY